MDGNRKLPEGVRPLQPDIRAIDDAMVVPFLNDWFERAAGSVDLDRAMIMGTNARSRPPALLYEGMPGWLGVDAPIAVTSNAAWFLAGLWTPDSEIPDAVIDHAASALRRLVDVPDARDPLIMALGIAAGAHIGSDARTRIATAFSAVRKSTKIGSLPAFAEAALQAVK